MPEEWDTHAKTFAQHHILLMFAFCLLVSLGTLLYFYQDLKQFKAGSQNDLLQVQAELSSKFDLLQNETRANQEAMEYRLNSKDQVMEQAIRAIRDEYQARMQVLLKSVNEIEQKSNVQLDDLKKQLDSSGNIPKDFSDVVDKALNSIVSVTTDKALASAAIIRSDGIIVTNNHVVDGAKSIAVTTRSGKVYDALVLYKTPDYDLAFLKIQDSGLPIIEFADSDLLRPGEKVMALGNPAGLQFSATEGIVSATHRSIGGFTDVLQIDVTIQQGSSGGPVINKYGRIIGITSFKIKGQQDLGFAIPSNTVRRLFENVVN